jgi:hypothetical protein
MAFHDWGPIIIDIPDKATATVTHDAGTLTLDAPVIYCLEERPDLILLGEFELRFVDPWKGDGVPVACLKVCSRWVQMRCVKIQVGPTWSTPKKPKLAKATWVIISESSREESELRTVLPLTCTPKPLECGEEERRGVGREKGEFRDWEFVKETFTRFCVSAETGNTAAPVVADVGEYD